jgi:hypothetical protein
MTQRCFLVVSLILMIAGSAAGQGVFFRVAPRFDLLKESYESPWQEYISIDERSSYGFEGDVGLIVQPRRLAVNLRVSTGLRYQHATLHANIADRGLIDSGFVVNDAYEETYEFICVPVTIELLYSSRSARVSPGVSLTLLNTFVTHAAGSSSLISGGSESYDIPTAGYIPSIAVGAFLDVILSRTVSVEFSGGYTYMLGNILKDTEADLRLHAVNLKAGLVVRVL